jgi:hypothetical protein
MHLMSKTFVSFQAIALLSLSMTIVFELLGAKVCIRVSVQGAVSLGNHFATLCRKFDFYEVKNKYIIIFQKENGNTFTLLIIFISAGINVQSPQSESTHRRLTLVCIIIFHKNGHGYFSNPNDFQILVQLTPAVK